MQILIVEDEPGLMALWRLTLENSQHTGCFAKNIKTAQALAIRLPPDVVITDYYLPDGNGLDFLRWLRQEQTCCHAYAVMTTSDPFLKLTEHTDLVSQYHLKPLQTKPIITSIEKVLGERASY